MTQQLASLYAGGRRRALTERLGLSADSLPAGGNFYPEEDVLALLAEKAGEMPGCQAVVLGAGLATPVLARAVASVDGHVTVLETDPRTLEITASMLDGIEAHATLLHAELEDYDKHNMWYARHRLGRLPDKIDLLFLDGPGHFAGRMPRWPAGPELFHRLSDRGIVVLDDGRRVKEKKALKRWAQDYPRLDQIKTKTSGGAVILRAL